MTERVGPNGEQIVKQIDGFMDVQDNYVKNASVESAVSVARSKWLIALLLAFVQITKGGCLHDTVERTPDSIIPRDLNSIRRQGEVRIGTEVSGDLGRP